MNQVSNKRMTERKDRYYTVPEAYFTALESRLREIPSSAALPQVRVPLRTALRPALALAASIAVFVMAGTFVLRKSVSPAADYDAEYFEYAYSVIPHTEPYSIYDYSLAESLAPGVTEEDVVYYLIETGVSLEELGYLQNYY